MSSIPSTYGAGGPSSPPEEVNDNKESSPKADNQQMNASSQINITPTSTMSVTDGDIAPVPSVAKSIHDFHFIKPISRGTYGKVYLGCRKDKPSTLYAIKAIKKEDLVRKNMVNSVLVERRAFCLSAADPFCVRLFYSLQTMKTVYLVMEYMIGGDLKSMLAIMGFFDVKAAAFYTAEISSALNFIHKCGVVHRDVKPDNILIDARGHIKLTDFGLSRVNMETDLTPRRMNNFTPGQLMSLKTEFCFPTSSPVDSGDLNQMEDGRGNENSFSVSCDMATPTCSQHLLSSVITLNRRFRKPLRKLRNVENKAEISFPNSIASTNTKLTPETPKYDMGEWSIIETPKENKPRFVEYGSFLNVTFEKKQTMPNLDLVSSDVFLHHSSPIDSSIPAKKVMPPMFSPLMSVATPHSSGTFYYEQSENTSKRHKSGEFADDGVKLKSEITFEPSSLNSVESDFPMSPSFNTPTSTIPPRSPEHARRDHTHMINMHLMHNLSHSLVPAPAPEPIPKQDMAMSVKRFTKRGNSFKRKRWINSASRTGISLTMKKLGIGSLGSRQDGLNESATGKKNESPPDTSGARIVGTPDYLAPEIIAKKTHGPAVDWWSLGICLYEFVVGCLPFSGESLNSIFHNIETRDLEFPDTIDPEVQKCIEALLDLDPEKRPDLSRLRSSEFWGFFGDLPWDDMSLAQPPFVPAPSSPTDTGYFAPRNVNQNIRVSEVTLQ